MAVLRLISAVVLRRFCLWLVVCLMGCSVAACGVVNGGFQTVAGVWGSISDHKLELSECHSISSSVWESVTSVLLLRVCVWQRTGERVHDRGGRRARVAFGLFLSLIFFFVSRLLSLSHLHTYTPKSMKQREKQRWQMVTHTLWAFSCSSAPVKAARQEPQRAK